MRKSLQSRGNPTFFVAETATDRFNPTLGWVVGTNKFSTKKIFENFLKNILKSLDNFIEIVYYIIKKETREVHNNGKRNQNRNAY